MSALCRDGRRKTRCRGPPTKPVHICFSFNVGNTPHKAAMRSMELMIGEVKPRVEKALR